METKEIRTTIFAKVVTESRTFLEINLTLFAETCAQEYLRHRDPTDNKQILNACVMMCQYECMVYPQIWKALSIFLMGIGKLCPFKENNNEQIINEFHKKVLSHKSQLAGSLLSKQIKYHNATFI